MADTRMLHKLLDLGTLEIDANFLLAGHPNGAYNTRTLRPCERRRSSHNNGTDYLKLEAQAIPTRNMNVSK